MAERRRQNRANMPSRRSGGIGTTAGSILGVLDSLPSARNEEFDPEQAPTGENMPYKRGGMFARMTGSGVRADRRNNDAYDAWVDSKMADEEELRGAANAVKAERIGAEERLPGLGRQLWESSNLYKGLADIEDLKSKRATSRNTRTTAEKDTELRNKRPDVVEGNWEATMKRPGAMTDAENRRIDLMGADQTMRAEQFLKKFEQDNEQFREQIGLQRMGTEAEIERGNRYNTGDGSVMDIKEGKIFRAGGPRDFKTTRRDALGNEVEITETRNEQPGVYNFGGAPAQGGRIKMNPKITGENMPNESGATDGERRPVPLTGNEGKDGNERPLALEAQGGGGNPNGGRPPSWPSEEVRGGKLADITGKIKPVVGGPLEDDMISEAMLERMKRVRKPDYGTTREFTF